MQIEFTLTGTQAILFHADDIEAGDELMEWRKDPRNKNVSVPGDDRSPGWTWQSYLYTDGEHLTIPSENLMACLRKAGAKLIMKRQTTFKEASQTGLVPDSEFLNFCGSDGKQISMAKIKSLKELPFKQQAEAVKKFNFKLYMKRAKVGQAKHVRVRARFETGWSVRGSLRIDPAVPELTFDVTKQIFQLAGRVGLLDWRPGSPKSPGVFGMFKADLRKVG